MCLRFDSEHRCSRILIRWHFSFGTIFFCYQLVFIRDKKWTDAVSVICVLRFFYQIFIFYEFLIYQKLKCSIPFKIFGDNLVFEKKIVQCCFPAYVQLFHNFFSHFNCFILSWIRFLIAKIEQDQQKWMNHCLEDFIRTHFGSIIQYLIKTES